MRDQDDLTDIPSLVPTRDELVSHQRTRRGQTQEIVPPGRYGEVHKVSTWPVRIMLTLLAIAALGGAGGAWYFYGLYTDQLQNTEQRIHDLEQRLLLAGDSVEASTSELSETLEFHFSEIDKLWAARNALREQVNDVNSQIAKLNLANEGQNETMAQNSQLIANNSDALNANATRLNTLSNELAQVRQSVQELDESMRSLDTLRASMQSVQETLNSGDSTVGGLMSRVEFVEQSLESINAHRLQINETLLRLQEQLQDIQRGRSPSASAL